MMPAKETETVIMEKGLLAALQKAIPALPAAGWGNVPGAAVQELLNAVAAAHIAPPAKEDAE